MFLCEATRALDNISPVTRDPEKILGDPRWLPQGQAQPEPIGVIGHYDFETEQRLNFQATVKKRITALEKEIADLRGKQDRCLCGGVGCNSCSPQGSC
jgi:hypothetical protein